MPARKRRNERLSKQRRLEYPIKEKRFEELPNEIHNEIFAHVGVALMCRFFVNIPLSRLKMVIARYLKTCVVKVTPEEVFDGDLNKIDFYTCAKLPKCHIDVITLIGMWQLTKWHLSQVKYELLSLTINHLDNRIQYVNLKKLKGNVTALNFEGKLEIRPKEIPLTVTKLSFHDCKLLLPQSFKHLTSLTHFSCWSCYRDGSFALPKLITTLIFGGPNESVVYNASSLINLKHISGNGITAIRWGRLQSILAFDVPYHVHLSSLKEITITGSLSGFKDLSCPRLESVICNNCKTNGEVQEFFTNEQLAHLTSLKVENLYVHDMSLIQQLKALHMKLDEPLTEQYLLPPNLVELKVCLSQPVKGIPPHIERFEYFNAMTDEPQDIKITSQKLKSLLINLAKLVTVECPKLTTVELLLGQASFFAPNIVNLTIKGEQPRFRYPRLNHYTMFELHRCELFVKHFKYISVNGTQLSSVWILADEVTLRDCVFPENSGKPYIVTKVLNLHCKLLSSDGISCQELYCGKSGMMGCIPPMVEKVFIDRLDNGWIDTSTGVPVSFKNCTKLRSLSIALADFTGIYKNGLTIPTSVRQLYLGNVIWSKSAILRFDKEIRPEHIECWSAATMDQLGCSRVLPPSLFLPVGALCFQSHLLRQHKSE